LTGGDFSARVEEDVQGELHGVMAALNGLAGCVESSLQATHASERRYRRLIEHMPAGVFRTRLDGRVLDCNAAAARLLGYDSEVEAKTYNARTFYARPEERERLIQRLAKETVLTNTPLVFRRKDGRELPIKLSIARSTEGGETVLEGVFVADVPGATA
jgi:PAS domain S-box-containing protein